MATQRSDLSRRTFLSVLGQVGGASAVYGAMTAMGLAPVPKAYAGPPDLPAQSGRGTRVLIVGAGIAGLVAALELRKAGYAVTLLEARDRPAGRVFTVRAGTVIEESDSRQVANWDRGPDLFFDAGAARLPQHHQGILDYARQFEVPLELINNENRAALLQHSKAFGGAPQRSRHVAADARGFVAEMAAKVVDQARLDHPVTTEDKEKLSAFLRAFGGLDEQLRYRGSDRAGYSALPAAGTSAGRNLDPLDINHLLKADFWSSLYAMCEGPTQGAAMLRPVGGMANIANAMARSLGGLIRYNTVVTRIQRRGDGARIEWKDANSKRTGASDAPYVLITIQPHLLTAIDNDLSPRVRQALAAPKASSLAKVAFQAERRFWELDDNIYGGISWTDHPITQIWYPSQGIHGKKGILVGAYLFSNGETFAQKTLDERLALALEGGERLHKDYRQYVGHGVSISWLKAKYSYGATAHWSDEARQNEYPVLLSPDGPYHFAGEYLSYINGWQEGALRSAHVAIEQIANRVREKKT